MIMFQQMIILFILIMVGYIGNKFNIIDEIANKNLSGIVVNIANPALIISGALGNRGDIIAENIIRSLLLSIIIFIVLIVISFFIPHIIKSPKSDYGIYKMMTVFSNIGFMGFPIISAIYGSSSLLYASIFLIPYNVLIYTYGIAVIKQNDGKKNKMNIKDILNIGVIACIIMMIIYAFDLTFPEWCKTPIIYLSNLTAPLSMIVIGSSLAMIRFKDIFCDLRLLIFSLIKLIVIPVIGVLIIKVFVDDAVLRGICMIMLAAPIGSMNAMMAREYCGNYELASRGVALSTILSVCTLPLVSVITQVL